MLGLECTFDNRMSTMKDFHVIKQVGKGSYGVVYKVRRKSDGNIYAIKTISLSNRVSSFFRAAPDAPLPGAGLFFSWWLFGRNSAAKANLQKKWAKKTLKAL